MSNGKDKPITEDNFLRGVGLEIFIHPFGQHRGFFEIKPYVIPDGVNGVFFAFKESIVAFLPNIPYEKPRDELPNFVEDGVLIRMIMLVLDGVSNITLLFISSSAECGFFYP